MRATDAGSGSWSSPLLVLLSRWRIDVAWLGLAAIPFARPTAASILACLPLTLAALGLRIWARGHLERDIYLTQTGPYAVVRHPLYIGSFLLGLSFALMTRVSLFVLLFPPLFSAMYLPKAFREEAFLRRCYGDEHGRYAARVPALLPTLRGAVPSGFAREAQRFAWRRVVRNHEWQTWLGALAVLLLMWARAGGLAPLLAHLLRVARVGDAAAFAGPRGVGHPLPVGR
jgi:protein-S-isoprenylcysteine O-methyltransferase Ste14